MADPPATAEQLAELDTEATYQPAAHWSGGLDSPTKGSPDLPEIPAEVVVDNMSAAAHAMASVIRYPTPAADSPAPATKAAASAAGMPASAAELLVSPADSPAPQFQPTEPAGEEAAEHALSSVIRYPTPILESPQPVRMATRATPAPAKKQSRLAPVAAGEAVILGACRA